MSTVFAFAQQDIKPYQDSLVALLPKVKDTARVNTLNLISNACEGEPKLALDYVLKGAAHRYVFCRT